MMLSETWEDGRHNAGLRTNLFRDLSRIILTLTRTPLPKIGSFVIDDGGFLRLSNRPLTSQLQQLEYENVPVEIPRDGVHLNVSSYVNDVLTFHDSRLSNQPNAVNDIEDGFYQASALMVMRSIWPRFFRRDLLRGPFFFTLTDIHQSNIMVDDNWHIKCLIDLEWACVLPAEMIHPPYWLSSQSIDTIKLDDYEPLHKEFMCAFVAEEIQMFPGLQGSFRLSNILQQGWESGTFWCCLALDSPTALFAIFYDYIQPRFCKAHSEDSNFWAVTIRYWQLDALPFLKQKVKDKEQYDESLRKAFESQDT